jgi:oligopeptide transport system substrate-binding protein
MSQQPNRAGQDWWNDPEQRALFEERMSGTPVTRRALLGLIGAVASGAVVIACGGGNKTQESKATTAPGGGSPGAGAAAQTGGAKLAKEQTFRSVAHFEPVGFDYNKDLYSMGTAYVLAGLLQFDPDYNVMPDMAESFTVNDTGDVYTFKIRKDSKWSNGDPVTAKDFEWSWKRQLDPKTAASYAGFLFDIKNAQAFNEGKITDADQVGVKATDDSTLQVTLEGPRGYFPILAAYIASFPAHRASVEKYGDKYSEAGNFVGNGPFKLTKWEHNKSFEIAKNDGYWNAKNIKIERVTYPIIAQEATFPAYQNNEIDYVDRGDIGNLKLVQNDAKMSKEMFKFSPVGTWYLMPNPNFKPFDLKEVRLAMAHAIDRDKIAKDIYQGLAQPAYTMNPPGTPGYNENKYDQYTKYDPKMAMDLLKGTPYEGGKNWPKITLSQRKETDADAAAGEAIIQMLKDNLGMKDFDHEIGEPKETYLRMYQNKIQLMWIRWYMDYPDPNNFNWQCFYSKVPESSKRSHWVNEDYDKLVDQAKGEKDQAKRIQLYHQSDEVLAKDGGAIFVHYPLFYGMFKPWVQGLPQNKQGLAVPDWNIFVRMLDRLSIAEH